MGIYNYMGKISENEREIRRENQFEGMFIYLW